MSEAMQESMAEPFAPGNIVRLRQPYKPGDPDGPWRNRRAEWRNWPGWTHGVVAEVISRERGPASWGQRAGAITRVSLHLYDPERALLYVHDRYTVPAYVDFHVNELIPHKIATDPGYAILPALE